MLTQRIDETVAFLLANRDSMKALMRDIDFEFPVVLYRLLCGTYNNYALERMQQHFVTFDHLYRYTRCMIFSLQTLPYDAFHQACILTLKPHLLAVSRGLDAWMQALVQADGRVKRDAIIERVLEGYSEAITRLFDTYLQFRADMYFSGRLYLLDLYGGKKAVLRTASQNGTTTVKTGRNSNATKTDHTLLGTAPLLNGIVAKRAEGDKDISENVNVGTAIESVDVVAVDKHSKQPIASESSHRHKTDGVKARSAALVRAALAPTDSSESRAGEEFPMHPGVELAAVHSAAHGQIKDAAAPSTSSHSSAVVDDDVTTVTFHLDSLKDDKEQPRNGKASAVSAPQPEANGKPPLHPQPEKRSIPPSIQMTQSSSASSSFASSNAASSPSSPDPAADPAASFSSGGSSSPSKSAPYAGADFTWTSEDIMSMNFFIFTLNEFTRRSLKFRWEPKVSAGTDDAGEGDPRQTMHLGSFRKVPGWMCRYLLEFLKSYFLSFRTTFTWDRRLFIEAMKLGLAIVLASLNEVVPRDWPPIYTRTHHGWWAAVTVAFTMADSLGGHVSTMIMRVLGTFVGAVIGYIIAQISNNNVVSLVALLTVWNSLCTFSRSHGRYGYACMVAGFTAIVVSVGSDPSVGTVSDFAFVRIEETLIGVLIGLVIHNFLLPVHASTLLHAELLKNVTTIRDAFEYSFGRYQNRAGGVRQGGGCRRRWRREESGGKWDPL